MVREINNGWMEDADSVSPISTLCRELGMNFELGIIEQVPVIKVLESSISGIRCRCFLPFRITYVPLFTIFDITAGGGYGTMSSAIFLEEMLSPAHIRKYTNFHLNQNTKRLLRLLYCRWVGQ